MDKHTISKTVISRVVLSYSFIAYKQPPLPNHTFDHDTELNSGTEHFSNIYCSNFEVTIYMITGPRTMGFSDPLPLPIVEALLINLCYTIVSIVAVEDDR